MPKLEQKLEKDEIQVARNDVWVVLKWQDKKEVYVITTVHGVQFRTTGKKNWKTKEDVVKPACICDYNKNIGGVDNIDRQLSLQETIRITMK